MGRAKNKSARGEWKPTLTRGGRVRTFAFYEKEIYMFALRESGGCVLAAAASLGISRATVYRALARHGISLPSVAERRTAARAR